MGTNYYAQLNTCKTCGHPEYEVHIGKNSYGWPFAFQVQENLDTFDKWMEFLEKSNCIIKNEYGREVFLKELKEKIEASKMNTLKCDCTLDKDGYHFMEGDFS